MIVGLVLATCHSLAQRGTEGSPVTAFLIYSCAIRNRSNSLKTQGRHHV